MLKFFKNPKFQFALFCVLFLTLLYWYVTPSFEYVKEEEIVLPYEQIRPLYKVLNPTTKYLKRRDVLYSYKKTLIPFYHKVVVIDSTDWVGLQIQKGSDKVEAFTL